LKNRKIHSKTTSKSVFIKIYSPQRRGDQRDFALLLFADPRGIGFAFHRAGTPKNKTNQPFG
jgi:hypothetical protein